MNSSPDPSTKSQSTVAEELEKFLGPKRKADADLSGVFSKPSPAADLENVHKLQVQTRDRLENLEQLVGSLKRTLLVLTCSVMALVLTCAAVSVLLYQRWDTELANKNAVASETGTVDPQVAGNAAPGAVTASPFAMELEPLSEADQKIYPLIFDLYRRARQLRGGISPGSTAGQIDSTTMYANFLTDASSIAEKAAQESVSQDLMLAIVKIVELGKLSRNYVGGERLEAELLEEEIRAILRQFTPRDARFDPTRG